MQAVCMIADTKTEWKRKMALNWWSIFHWQKARNNARAPDTAKLRWTILSVLDPAFGCFYQIFRKQILLFEALQFYMLVKSSRTVLRELSREKHVYIGLTWFISWGCCDNTLLLCKTCLHAVYHRPMA